MGFGKYLVLSPGRVQISNQETRNSEDIAGRWTVNLFTAMWRERPEEVVRRFKLPESLHFAIQSHLFETGIVVA